MHGMQGEELERGLYEYVLAQHCETRHAHYGTSAARVCPYLPSADTAGKLRAPIRINGEVNCWRAVPAAPSLAAACAWAAGLLQG